MPTLKKVRSIRSSRPVKATIGDEQLLSTATAGLFSATGGGGTAIASTQALTVTASTANTNNNTQSLTLNNGNTEAYNFTSLFFHVGTAQGSAATADACVEYIPSP